MKKSETQKNEEEGEESLNLCYGFPIVTMTISMGSPCSSLQDLSSDTSHDSVGCSGQPGEAGE